jgi:hypothetical protein
MDVKEIEINIVTAMSSTSLILNKDMFVSGSISSSVSLNRYPYFIANYRLPKEAIRKLSLAKRIETFFNKVKFEDVMSGQEEQNTCCMSHNLDAMIKLLFPTKYPSIDDNTESFQRREKTSTSTFSFVGLLPSILDAFFPSYVPRYSYLVIGGQKYTVTATRILNDIENHPRYSGFLSKCIVFFSYMRTIRPEIKRKMENAERSAQSTEYRQLFRNYLKTKNTQFLIDIRTKLELRRRPTADIDVLLSAIAVYRLFCEGTKQRLSPDAIRYMNEHYAEFRSFNDAIKQYSSAKIVTKNSRLQTMIDDAVNSGRYADLGVFASNFASTYSCPNNFIGVTWLPQTKQYSSFVSFSLVQGELTDDAISKISCTYKNHQIGNLLLTRRNHARRKRSPIPHYTTMRAMLDGDGDGDDRKKRLQHVGERTRTRYRV